MSKTQFPMTIPVPFACLHMINRPLLTSGTIARIFLVSLSVLSISVLLAPTRLVSADRHTDSSRSLPDQLVMISGRGSYRNSLLGYEVRFPENWEMHAGISMGYPYVSVTDPVAQSASLETTDLHQGALIEVSAEDYLSSAPLGEYIKSFVPLDAGSLEAFSPLHFKESISNTWGVEGLSVTLTDGGLFYTDHATIVNYSGSRLLLQIRLTVFHTSSEREQAYLDVFNQVLASLRFSPPPAMPQPAAWSSGTRTGSVPLDLMNLSANEFLTLPFNDNSKMQVAQGWYYSWGGSHGGVDYINGVIGSTSTWGTFDVLAAEDGEACANCVYGPGSKVWIKHIEGNGVYYTYYGHLATIDPDILASTVWVKRGQKIGTAGNTGTTYIHLHFGAYNAAWSEVDPYDLYTTRYAYYPNSTSFNMGAGNLFTHDPPLYPSDLEEPDPTPTPTPVPTPTATPDPDLMRFFPVTLR